jgi:hypothetical protein
MEVVMKKLSTKQLKIIIALNVVIILLLVGVMIFAPPLAAFLPSNPSGGGDPSDKEAVHSRLRAANISLNPSLAWELELLGSGEETAKNVFIKNNTIYIFGNTSSHDLDFDKEGVFLAIMDTYGVTKAFFVYGEKEDKLQRAIECEGGFLLAIEGSKAPYLLVVDGNGLPLSKKSDFSNRKETILSLKYYQNRYFLFTNIEDNTTAVKSLRIYFFDENFNFVSSTIARDDYSLLLFDFVVISDKVIAFCSAYSEIGSHVVAISFVSGASAEIHEITDGNIKGFSVFDDNYIFLTDENGSTFLMVGMDFVVKSKINLLQQVFPIKMVQSGENFLIFLENTTYFLTGKGEHLSSLEKFSAVSEIETDTGVIVSGENMKINYYTGGRLVFVANVGSGENPMLASDGKTLLLVCHKNGNVNIVKVRYPQYVV